ncbi:hypothetical protein F3087_06950 [Nocardia colli]|uniref:DUF6779 domain-containing protein n=1 Tax=Nocardia colli TaxID=2545717 RepID=A0A5N0EL75_9NOCA|nr:DUF6779 domain-containing protein [Nocardia colli]KAA8889753.1 hypothetical protein F3087_06950 [Nocardia colli]
MVSPSRTSTSRRRRDDAGKLFIGVLILLGLVASVFLVFSNSLQFVRIGLVAALWAAVIGALAATRYRKEATIDKAKVRDLQTVYELQLEREVTARREFELGIEARVREEVGADATELAALRAELTVLRTSLQRLFDGDLPMDRPALRADATRIQELTSAVGDPANNSSANAGPWSVPSNQQPRSSVTPVFVPDHPEPPLFASPFDDPVTAETSAVSLDDDETDAEVTDIDLTDVRDGDPERSGSGWADAFTEGPVIQPTPPAPRPAPKPTYQSTRPSAWPTTEGPTVGTASSRRRRRAEADADSDTPERRLSVAEIMANLQSEEKSRDRR